MIERTEDYFCSRNQNTAAANDWLKNRPTWEDRVGPEVFFTLSCGGVASYALPQIKSPWSATLGNFVEVRMVLAEELWERSFVPDICAEENKRDEQEKADEDL